MYNGGGGGGGSLSHLQLEPSTFNVNNQLSSPPATCRPTPSPSPPATCRPTPSPSTPLHDLQYE